MRKPYNYHHVDKIGDAMVEVFHVVGLFVIGATVVWSGVVAYMEMINHGHASLKDILLLFIYLELGAMVGIYFKTRRLPVQFLIYIAITALTRMLTIDIKGMPDKTILTVTGAILMLTLAILILRYTNTMLKEENE
ncbi:MAG: phosphate-starvation-inducible PsiE family protein [Candidatus Thiodiazotropha sp. (ex Lucina aurantia)]|uniref:Protein PsiE n=1 Tax=Candidatus Thiodiazotropha endolucinida TaxID=1655433 RepID=A0A7Z1AG39_9GAMM|nr:phosphate-starvation-inducible PsiE family protein [Candidatus Thiodiazotropha endolucinida]MBT3011492.1 phosphate-starvation-inducible PsiE family protein [Candidatus Thiodiazotropha sp. (ex Lucina pensylvanica)]MBT3023083.1 phosphate-starvation-inducible PsiE family protein [Candidatus Thiodiazotropha taylori]MBT3038449.1 phosphate-starvation-inducible PsiE family protein [Candidatus Thiodiazotropha sp. (ex Codakia orbicularis)]MBV2102860.1 phosphate-starvation-inducible PsiE family protei